MNKENAKWVALIILLTAPLLSVIDVFIINVAIPAIKKGVHATDGQVQLVIAGYLLGYAAFLITGGRAGDHFGRKKVFFWGMFFFTLMSCVCGLSQNALQLNASRFFQGCSASFMVPQTIAYIQVLFVGAKERAKAIGYFGITLGMASIIGQVLGGYFSDTDFAIAGWRLIFFINLPIGIAALWATWKYLDETEKNATQKFDYSGVAILTAALVCLIFPLIEGRESGWPMWSIIMLLSSAVVFTWFIRDQRKKLLQQKDPLIHTDLFNIKDFNIGILAALFHFMMHTSFLLISAVYLQNGLGISALDCGLYFVLPGSLFTLSSVLSIKLVVRFGKRVLQVGVALLVLTFILQVSIFKPHVSGWYIFLLMGLYGFANGLVLPSLLNMALKSVPPKFAGAAAGVYSTFQQTASALGVSIIGGIFYFFLNRTGGNYQQAFAFGVVTIVCCLCIVSVLLYLLPNTAQQQHAEIHLD